MPRIENIDEYAQNLYLTDEYVTKNPSLHQEDSPWKMGKITPLIDKFMNYFGKHEVNVLDVGGGAGLILKAVGGYIEKSFGVKVNKFALDLSPRMLKIQKKTNSDLKEAINEDIRKTSLSAKEIDLTLLIDVLEHIPNPIEALKEVGRISGFVILKVPLEDNLTRRIWNFVNLGKPRQLRIETIGHINNYNFGSLRQHVEKYTGQMLDFYYTNVFGYFLKMQQNEAKWGFRIRNLTGAYLFRRSPELCSLIFNDFVMVLVKCF